MTTLTAISITFTSGIVKCNDNTEFTMGGKKKRKKEIITKIKYKHSDVSYINHDEIKSKNFTI